MRRQLLMYARLLMYALPTAGATILAVAATTFDGVTAPIVRLEPLARAPACSEALQGALIFDERLQLVCVCKRLQRSRAFRYYPVGTRATGGFVQVCGAGGPR